MSKMIISCVLMTLAAIQYGLVPPLVDLSDSHVFHPEWPPHARFHLVWLLAVNSTVAAVVLKLIWWPGPNRAANIKIAGWLGLIVLSGFYVALMSIDGYGGAMSDVADPPKMFGIDGNTFGFSIAAVLQVLGLMLIYRADENV